MPQQRLRRRSQTKADSSGAVTFVFDSVEAGRAWVGSVSVLGGQSSMVMVATVSALPWGGWTAEKPSGPIQGVEHEVLTVTGTGFTPGSTYTAWWIGADQDLAHAELFGPANPLSVSTNVNVNPNTLDFEHNDALVATEPAVDFDDGGGVTFTLTDDPTNKRMKVEAAVSATGAGVLLVATYHDPAVPGSASSSSANFAAVDTVNLRATFLAPASGAVIVRLGGCLQCISGAQCYLGVLDGATVRAAFEALFNASASAIDGYVTASKKITGLNPGQQYNWDLAFANGAGATGTAKLLYGGGASTAGTGPAFIEVVSA